MKLGLVSLLFTLFASSAFGFEVKLNVVADKKDCESEPQGVYSGQKVRLDALVSGKDVNTTGLRYTFFMSLHGFEVDPLYYGQTSKVLIEKSTFNWTKVKVMNLKADVTRVDVLYGVMVEDGSGKQVTAVVRKPVTRRVFLVKNTDYTKSCYRVEAPEIISGVYVNLNDTDTTVTTTDGEQKITEGRKSKSKGWAIAPSVFAAGIGLSLFSFDVHHMKSLAHQVMEGTSTSVSSTLNNGDAGFLYKQTTRFKQAFDVYSVNGCGQGTNQGIAWAEVEHTLTNFHKVDPTKPVDEVFRSRAFGKKLENTCQEVDANSVNFLGIDE